MPAYTFLCDKCNYRFEVVCSIREYSESQVCAQCNSKKHVHRCYIEDVATLNASVKKSDNELKTVGDLANRNRDRMSDDQRLELYAKHNDYKEAPTNNKPLPKGLTRMKKQPKTKWT